MEELLATIRRKDNDAILPEEIAAVRHIYSVGDKIRTETKDAFGQTHIKKLKIVRFHPYLVELQHLRTITYADLVCYMRSDETPIKMYDDCPQGRNRKGA